MNDKECNPATEATTCTRSAAKKKRYQNLQTFKVEFTADEYSILTQLAELYNVHRTEIVRRLINMQRFRDLAVSIEGVAEAGDDSQPVQLTKKKQTYDELMSFTIRFQKKEWEILTHISKRQSLRRTDVVHRLLNAVGALHGIYGPQQEKILQATA